MRCGNCNNNHGTVAEVKDCYTKGPQPLAAPTPTTRTAQPQWPASEPQKGYIRGLIEQRVMPDGYKPPSDEDLDMMEKDVASDTIKFLKSLAKKPLDQTKVQKEWTMPEGRYALLEPRGGPQENDRGWRFYKVDKPDKGRWKGYTFIKRLIGQPGSDYKPVAVEAPLRNAILERIEADPKQAMIDYGIQSKHCGRCGSALSNDDKPGPDGLTSIQRGIGPVCMFKDGWF